MEGDPHKLLEGMAIAAFAIGADEGYIYVRAEYPLAIKRLRKAIKDAEEKHFLGKNIMGTDFSFDLHIKEGAGAFVCGEESALIASIEGERGMPRPKPPFPANKGLFGRPTLINNVETLANIPVIMLTAKSGQLDKIKGLDEGADDYITKPFGAGELLARIRTAIRHTRTGLANETIATTGKFKAGDLEIDYDKHQVLVNGVNANLTQNEYKIIGLLGKCAGKVLTYDYIIKELWGPGTKGNNQSLRVHMANIRRKIEKNPAEPQYIFTEIGVGYRMVEGD